MNTKTTVKVIVLVISSLRNIKDAANGINTG